MRLYVYIYTIYYQLLSIRINLTMTRHLITAALLTAAGMAQGAVPAWTDRKSVV